MTDLEDSFRQGLRQAVADQPPLGPIDIDAVIARGQAGAPLPVRRAAPRWLAIAAALALVAGLGLGAVAWQTASAPVPAVPVAPNETPTTAGRSLTGVWWVATDFWTQKDGTGMVRDKVDTDAAPSLRLDDGTAQARSTCGRFTSSYTVDGDMLTFGEPSLAGGGCGASLAKIHWFTLRAIVSGPLQYHVTGSALELRNAAGELVARFSAGSGSPTPEPTGVTPTPTRTGVTPTPTPTSRRTFVTPTPTPTSRRTFVTPTPVPTRAGSRP